MIETIAGILFLAVVTVAAIVAAKPQGVQYAQQASSIRVIDGDTIQAPYGITYRISNIDTPETHQAKSEHEYALGMKAKARLQQLLSSGEVRIIESGKLDKYKRSLARLQVDGKDVGDILISEGLARPYNGGKRLPW